MTKYELDLLLRLNRQEAKTVKSATEARKAQVTADGEAKIAAKYPLWYKPEWEKMFREADQIVQKLNALIIADLAKEGIAQSFAPSAQLGWASRGENSFKERRAELRKVLETEVAAQQRTACTHIEIWETNTQRQLFTYGMESEEAKNVLKQRPALETLMPALELTEIENKLDSMSDSDRWSLRWKRS
jgi:hypothetical protein